MNKSSLQIIKDQEERIIFLENKLKSILALIEILVSGNAEKAKHSLAEHSENSVVLTLSKLIEKFSSDNSLLKKNDKTDLFLKIIIESMPFPVFIKDENARYIYVNTLEANLFNLKESEILGKHDSELVMDKEEIKIIKKSDEDVLLRNKTVELPNQKFSLSDDVSYVFKTHKIPFVNPFTERTNIMGFSVDVTDTVSLGKLQKVLVAYNSRYTFKF